MNKLSSKWKALMAKKTLSLMLIMLLQKVLPPAKGHHCCLKAEGYAEAFRGQKTDCDR